MRWIVGGTFTLVGLAVLVFAWMLRQEARRSQDWPSVTGVVTKNAVRTDARTGTGGSAARARYLPDVEFEYEVDGQRYNGSRFAVLEQPETERAAVLARLEAYPVGEQVEVYYDPADPARALLEPGTPGAMWIPFVFGALATGLGVVVVLAMKPKVVERMESAPLEPRGD